MFDVIDTTGTQHTVYEVNGAYFLIFDKELGWTYISMHECTPEKKQ